MAFIQPLHATKDMHFAEDFLGSIEVGKLADFVVIPVDYMTIPAEDIWKIEPERKSL